MTEKYFLDCLWRRSAKPFLHCNEELPKRIIPSYESLKETEWSPTFEKGMRDRLIMGAIRYGCLHERGKPKYDRISSAIKRFEKYKETGNAEFLLDIANLCLLEFEEPNHSNFHFSAIDEHNEHVKILK